VDQNVKSWSTRVLERERALSLAHAEFKRAGPAKVGFEHLGGSSERDDLWRLRAWATATARSSSDFFSAPSPTGWRMVDGVLSFTSPGTSGQSRNDRVVAQLHRGGHHCAVVLLPHWNALRESYLGFAKGLARMGITCLQLSLPFHDERQTLGLGYAQELVSENLGLTIKANRQAVLDVRACLDWLEGNGYARLGLIGCSVGSSIAALTASHDNRVRALVLLLMADDFTDVVWKGTASRHIRESLGARFTLEEVRAVWSVISPNTYAAMLAARSRKVLVVSGEKDKVFLPQQTEAWVYRLQSLDMEPTWIKFRCGHYTLAMRPYNYAAFAHTYLFLTKSL
jgi:pimeloyl-ACP methyl ester carboxylesterase